MQHDHVLKKINFDLLTLTLGMGGGGVFGQNMCYHVAAFMIPFNLICMQHDHLLNKLIFDLLTPSPRVVGGWGSACKIFATMLLNS